MKKLLGKQVEEFRKSKGWNTTRLAEAVKATRMAGTEKASRQNIEGLEAAARASKNRIPKYLGALAKVMGKSVDEMMTLAGLAKPVAGSAAPDESTTSSLSDEEQMVLDIYRDLDPAVRAAILKVAAIVSADLDASVKNRQKAQAIEDAANAQVPPVNKSQNK